MRSSARPTGGGTNPQLDEISTKLDQIQTQLGQLQQSVNKILAELPKLDYDTLVQPVENLERRILGTERRLTEALSYAGKKDKQATIDGLVHQIEMEVNAPSGLADEFNLIPEAIYGGGLAGNFLYLTLSHVVTSDASKPFFTWRTSARMDAVFQYLLSLQALQFNLVVQVESAAKSDKILDQFGTPYLGDPEGYKQFVDGQIPAPTSGSLHSELGIELTKMPPGLVLDTRTGLLWSQDVPGGAREVGFSPSGPGVPVCGQNTPGFACLAYNPLPDPELGQVAAKIGGGAYFDWKTPTIDQLHDLLSGWVPADWKRALRWIEAASGSNGATCTQTAAGSPEAVTNPNACIWPTTLNYWSSDWEYAKQNIQEFTADGWRLLRTYRVGFKYEFQNLDTGATANCFLLTPKIDWSDLGDDTDPPGTSKSYGTTGCGGYLVVVRQLSRAEIAKYYF